MLRLMTVAGSDSGGGAGIEADLKTFTALGAFGMVALTAVTAQNTKGVSGVWDLPPEAVVEQIRVVAEDLGVDAVKVGMLATAELVGAVAGALRRYLPERPVVVDPVMQAKGGQSLLAADAVRRLSDDLLPLATVVTPNLPEAAALTGQTLSSAKSVDRAGAILLARGASWVLVKGGHGQGDLIVDRLFGPSPREYRHPRLHTPHTHGTGCTLSSAIAVGLARGLAVPDAVDLAERYVAGAIRHAPGLGAGHGPLNHLWMLRPDVPREERDLAPWPHG
jgi:hydroxymethylpyrimidine/phosphomethylpyrimidine kinase